MDRVRKPNVRLVGGTARNQRAEGKPNKISLATQAENQYRTASERRAEGKALRENLPREAQGGWKSPKDRRNPVELLLETNEGRLPELVPIRHDGWFRHPSFFSRFRRADGCRPCSHAVLRAESSGVR
jgi:hypothetical protein